MAKKKSEDQGKKKLDLKQILSSADRKRYEWLSEQEPEQARSFSALIIQRFLSVSPESSGAAGYFLQAINEFSNQHHWEINGHPDLQWRLLCATGLGRNFYHSWLPMPTTRRTANPALQWLLAHRQDTASPEEQQLLIKNIDSEEFADLLAQYGVQEREAKSLERSWAELRENQNDENL